MFPILQFGPLSIATSSFVLLLGLIFGQYFSSKLAPKFGIKSDFMDKVMYSAFLFGIAGGRLGYLMAHPQTLMNEPLSIFSFSPLIFHMESALLAAGLYMLIATQRGGRSILKLLDALTPMLAVMLLAIPLAQFASGDLFGTRTQMPWRIEMWSVTRHPVQLYQLVGNLLVSAIFFRHFLSSSETRKPGTRFLWLIIGLASVSILLDGFRETSQLLFTSFRVSQLVAFGLVIAAMVGLTRLEKTADSETIPDLNE